MTDAVLLAGLVVAAAVVYALTAGADFGGGLWVMLAAGSRGRAQRELIARAVAPIWEANHVWLIFAIVVLFVCFPPVYAAIGTVLHVPIVVLLVGIVLRGAAFAFRSHDYGPSQWWWDVAFAVGSWLSPFSLGVCVGAVASGRVRVAEDGTVPGGFIDPWLAPFPLAVGGFAVAQFAFLAATYLVLEAQDDALRADFRARVLGSGFIAAAFAGLVLALLPSGAPVVWEGLWSAPFVLVAGMLSGTGAMVASFTRYDRAARALAAANGALVVLGWALGQMPYLIVPDHTITSAQASPIVLRTTLVVFGGGAVLLTPAFAWLYSVFKRGIVT